MTEKYGDAMIIDSHTHLFTPRIVANVSANTEMARELRLETDRAARRMGTCALLAEAGAAGVDACLLLPVAGADDVERVNRSFESLARESKGRLLAAATLHPDFPDIEKELAWMRSRGVRAVKLCSFSQGFSPTAPGTGRLLDGIAKENDRGGSPFFFVFIDTFYKADRYFGTRPEHVTTPRRLARLADRHSGIVFVAAHMGGLAAPFAEIEEHLEPRENLYLETSNAAHVLAEEEFLRLAERHGPERIVFGTDWPWFGQAEEMEKIAGLLERAGFSAKDRAKVFGGNMARLLGIMRPEKESD